VLETAWGGAKYETGPWAFTAAYYWWHQDAYIDYRERNCEAVTSANITSSGKTPPQFQGNVVGTNCAGDVNQVSFLIDYAFTKHFDVYTGVTWSDIGGGLASGFLKDTDTMVASGLRIKF
jgi:predicted porin